VQASAAGIAATLIVDVVKGMVRPVVLTAWPPACKLQHLGLHEPTRTAPPSPPPQHNKVIRMRMLRYRMFLGVGSLT
jgi:hypothetical protein